MTDTKTPKEIAANNFKNEVEGGEYINARQSKFKNTGEDITSSARHKAAKWKNLAQAEIEGNAEEMTNLKTLTKHNPHNIFAKPENAIGALAAHYVIQKLPKDASVDYLKKVPNDRVIFHEYVVPASGNLPERNVLKIANSDIPQNYPEHKYAKPWKAEDIKKKAREYYVDFYNHMVDGAKKYHDNPDSMEVIKNLKDHVSEFSDKHKQQRGHGERTIFGSIFGGIIDDFKNKAFHPRKSNSVYDHLNKFASAQQTHVLNDPKLSELHNKIVIQKQGTDADKLNYLGHIADSVNEHIKGKPLTSIFSIEKKKKGGFNPDDFYNTTLERVGPDHGFTDHVSHLGFLTDHAKMRGIQYGNSVSDPEREHHLSQTANALRDLTDILDLPAEMSSFNGRLGLAFGARGKGNALAHYEPNLRVINLTRKNGVGSLAHEWAHAFDDILGEVMHGKSSNFASEAARHKSNYGSKIPHASDEHEKIHNSLEPITKMLHSNIRNRMIKDWRENGGRDITSPKRMSEYWLSTKEMFARAFEQYLQNKMHNNGRKNTYLAGGSEHWLWPNKEEVQALTPHFDSLFENFRKSHFLKKSIHLINNLKKSNSSKTIVNLNPEHGKLIANEYSKMKHDPEHPEVKKAYEALINETKSQYQDMINKGFKFSKIGQGAENPYKTSKDLHSDIETNKHLWYFPTEGGFGSGNNDYSNHPMLQQTEFKDSEGKPMLANDVFRIVHDYRGHHLGGKSGFGPKGEHHAYLAHKKDFSPLAQKALATETIGQNSWVNYGPHSEHNRKNPHQTIYADQKAGLLPDYIINGKWHI